MTRPTQPDLFPRRAPEKPVARTYELPPDYGTETDWSPVEIPEELRLPTDEEKPDA